LQQRADEGCRPAAGNQGRCVRSRRPCAVESGAGACRGEWAGGAPTRPLSRPPDCVPAPAAAGYHGVKVWW